MNSASLLGFSPQPRGRRFRIDFTSAKRFKNRNTGPRPVRQSPGRKASETVSWCDSNRAVAVLLFSEQSACTVVTPPLTAALEKALGRPVGVGL